IRRRRGAAARCGYGVIAAGRGNRGRAALPISAFVADPEVSLGHHEDLPVITVRIVEPDLVLTSIAADDAGLLADSVARILEPLVRFGHGLRGPYLDTEVLRPGWPGD